MPSVSTRLLSARSARPASTRFVWLLAVLLLFCVDAASAQYFGRNKVQYDDFDFQVLRTEHFDIHFYEDERRAIPDVARMAERWNRRHMRTFRDTLSERKPLIFYANDTDFQQTNVVSGLIGAGTGGVTESLKERVVMPLTSSYGETDHVLGHELVHSFQYDIALNDTARFDLRGVPLWFVEGMAEYLSLGREHPHTAMWLRDAALRDDLPTIEQLTRRPGQFFPYRYGQAYLAYIGGRYGDATVPGLYRAMGKFGLDSAFVHVLGITPDSLSKRWIDAVKSAYLPATQGRTPAAEAGERVLHASTTGGELNVAPALSPDGRYVAFLSERDLFYVNLFIADAETGEIVHELDRIGFDAHFDAIRFIQSAGTWSPDGSRLAFVTFDEGDNELTILNVASGEVERRFSVDGVDAFVNPAWSPDGTSIALSGMNDGASDLYLVDVETGGARQLTDDRYADLQPAWSPDGQTLAFATDRGSEGTDFRQLTFAPMRLGLYHLSDESIELVRPFRGALHHNPQFAPDGRSLFFISDQDGFQDVYRLALDERRVYRVTNLQTGVSGISRLSPALSVARESGRLMMTVFSDGNYSGHSLEAGEARGELVRRSGGRNVAALLPPARSDGLVQNYLASPREGLPAPTGYDEEAVRDYDPTLTLDYVAPPSLGVTAGGPFGTGLSGGVGLYFSDMLGNQNLGVVVAARGTFKDIGGEVSYLNRGHRINYGASAGHIPIRYASSFVDIAEDPETGVVTERVTRIIRRIYSQEASAIGSYPFSTTSRFDLSGGFVRYAFDYEVERFFLYDTGTRRDTEDLDAPDPLYLFRGSAALVGDFSYFGFTSPLAGGRYRFEVSPLLGSASFVRLLADYRRYFFLRPVSFAVRGLHLGNYGANEEDPFATQHLGYSYYPGFVRGYSYSSFDAVECTDSGNGGCAEVGRLTGTRVALASAEMRVPVLGTPDLGLIPFRFLPTELTLFADAGLAWTADSPPVWKIERASNERIPVFSAGVASRFNLFGQIVFELYYARPFQRPEKNGVFGFRLVPGW